MAICSLHAATTGLHAIPLYIDLSAFEAFSGIVTEWLNIPDLKVSPHMPTE